MPLFGEEERGETQQKEGSNFQEEVTMIQIQLQTQTVEFENFNSHHVTFHLSPPTAMGFYPPISHPFRRLSPFLSFFPLSAFGPSTDG